VLGRIEVVAAPVSPGLGASVMMAIDRGRNALARRIDAIVGGDSGAIAAAMVTGKRDLLSGEAKEIIREAGIFHIITISGVQMTLVAAIFFVGLRRLLALSETLALAYPIKKWAALFAIAGAVFYDLATGSRVGTERALFMTVIMLTSVLLDRQALTMRNLAIAAALVILIQPEAIMGASFQLSFARLTSATGAPLLRSNSSTAPTAAIMRAFKWAPGDQPGAYLILMHFFQEPVFLDSVVLTEPGSSPVTATAVYGQDISSGYSYLKRTDMNAFLTGTYKLTLNGHDVQGRAVTYTSSVKIGAPRPSKPQGKSMAGQSITGSTGAPATLSP
jgi:ComEC/Rec2-related protein